MSAAMTMPADLQQRREEAVAVLARRYRSEGFTVEVQPEIALDDGTRLRPDLIAKRGGETILLVAKSSPSIAGSDAPLRRFAEIAQQRGWRFVVAIVDARDIEEIEVPAAGAVAEKLAEARALDPRSTAAPLLAWAVLESAARHALVRCGQRATRAMSPQALVQQLASLGLVSPDEEQHLQAFGSVRNRLAHGRWSPTGSAEPDVQRVLAVAERLIDPDSGNAEM